MSNEYKSRKELLEEQSEEIKRLKSLVRYYEKMSEDIINVGKRAGIVVHENPDDCEGCGCMMLTPDCIAHMLYTRRF